MNISHCIKISEVVRTINCLRHYYMAFPKILNIHARHIDIKIDLWPTNILNKQIKNFGSTILATSNITNQIALDHTSFHIPPPHLVFFSIVLGSISFKSEHVLEK